MAHIQSSCCCWPNPNGPPAPESLNGNPAFCAAMLYSARPISTTYTTCRYNILKTQNTAYYSFNLGVDDEVTILQSGVYKVDAHTCWYLTTPPAPLAQMAYSLNGALFQTGEYAEADSDGSQELIVSIIAQYNANDKVGAWHRLQSGNGYYVNEACEINIVRLEDIP